MDDVKRTSGMLDSDFLTLAFEASGDCVKMIALDGTLLAVNASGTALLGYQTQDDLVGRNWIDFWPDEERDGVRHALRSACDGVRCSLEGSLLTTNGILKWWNNTIVAVPNPNGRPTRLLVISRDVTEQREAGQALDRSVRLYQALIEASAEIVWHFDVAKGYTDRRGYLEFTGGKDVSVDEFGWLALIHPDDVENAKTAAARAAATLSPVVVEYRLFHKSGEWRWVEDRGAPVIDSNGVATDWVGMITDIHDRKIAENALQKSADHLTLAVHSTGLGTFDVNLATGERNWSPELYDLFGIDRTAPADRKLFESKIHPDDRARVMRELSSAEMPSVGPKVSVFRLRVADGVERWVETYEHTSFSTDGKPFRRVGTMRDIGDRRQAEQKAWMAAHTDALTGVANRTLFQTRLDDAVANAATNGTCVALVIIDVDRFKDLNDSLGHDAGDVLLCNLAERLKNSVPASATVARLGGDEFGVIVPTDSLADFVDLPSALLAILKQPVDYAGREVDCSASIGWSVYPDHDIAASALLKHADLALYEVKAAGRGQVRSYSPEMRYELERRINVLRRAKDALIRDAVFPFYQPKMALNTGVVVGFEALLRWVDDKGLCTPGTIGEALDDAELSGRLGQRMLERVVADMQAWEAAGVPFGHVALNIAAPQFYSQSLASHVLESLDAAGLKPGHLEIEVTERVLLDDGMEIIGRALRALAEAGVAISLDDFGTGFASLTHLKKFPVSWLKIDRSFISNIEQESDSAAIVRAVTHLAHDIGIKVVAEGIETRLQLDEVTRLGCDVGQGYLIGKPTAGSRIPFLLRHWSPKDSEHAYNVRSVSTK